MAKKDKQTADMFRAEVPKMPEGYYSGDKPNPLLTEFAESHLEEHPYDSESDDYEVAPFREPLQSTRATAIFNMHTYWSKKPHDAIAQYIEHYTKPGDLVLDPFCGSGGTALAALMAGRKAIAIDRSPAATFITRNYCTPVEIEALGRAFAQLESAVASEMEWLYGTICDRCGGKATTVYTLLSQTFQCPRCMEKVPLFDCVEAEGQTAKGKAKRISVCPYCHKKGIVEEISTRAEKFGVFPVLVSYICENGCRPVRSERRYNDSDSKKRKYFEEYDLAKIQEIGRKDIPHWYPSVRMMHAPEERECWGVKWRAGTSNFRTVDELFTKRNLWALAAIRDEIKGELSDELLFIFSSILLKSSKMMAHNSDGIGRIQKGTYYVPQLIHDVNVWKFMKEAAGDMIAGYQSLQLSSVSLVISTSDACKTEIPDKSVDYIFTDPPYAEKIQYGELNFVWEAWLDLDTEWHDDEIIVNHVRGRTEDDWACMMRRALRECFRVLKPGRYLSLCYHDTSEGTWAVVQDIMSDVGFLVDATGEALFIETKAKTTNQYFADKVNKRDLVINFRKPREREELRLTGKEDRSTFTETAVKIIREYLASHPGATKDRVYDELVSRMVHAGQMEAHDFDALLSQVADEVGEPKKKDLFTDEDPDLFGGHEVRRWYLKESEDGAEESDRAVADDVAGKVENQIVKYTEAKLNRTQEQWDSLNAEAEKLGKELERPFKDEEKKKRTKLRKDLDEVEKQIAKLKAERDEWAQHALHYSYISEYYFPLHPKPRCTLVELLEDYFFQTEEGNWRPPSTDDERREKADARGRAVRRTLQRFCRMLESGEAIPAETRPDDATLAEWIRHCKRSGMYEQGKLLYEQGGLDLDKLPEKDMANLEEDYLVCVRMLSRAEQGKPKRRRKE